VTHIAGRLVLIVFFALGFVPSRASAQIFEAVGGRALGMGGAFVAVADDSTATWWNPAGHAAGPFFDLALGWSGTDIDEGLPARRERATSIAVAIPPLGLSFYRFGSTNVGQFRTIAPDAGGREDRRAAVPEWSLSAIQVGATLVHTLVTGVHVGTTLKYVRANGLAGELTGFESATVNEWLDQAGDFSGVDVENNFDLDVGLMAVTGPVRLGAVVRNVRETEVGAVKVPTQARVGVAFDTSQVTERAVMVALDADVKTYETGFGDRRVVAVGAETWGTGRGLGIRAGARFNTTGAEERAFTVGASVALRSSVYVDGYAVFGGADDERGWGIAARASF
jgi:hypothetical protein